jgi:hypothetical protein
MQEGLNTADFLVQSEGFRQFRRIQVEGGDPVLFAMLNGLLEQTIRCRSLDVANTFKETFLAKVVQLKGGKAETVQSKYSTIMDLFDQALQGRLTLDQAREALLDVQSTDVMQALFIQDNRTKIWVIERLNDGIPVVRDDEAVIPWFCKTFGIKICIFWLEGQSEYERVEFLSPRVGMIVNIYQSQNEFDIDTGLLYFADYDEEAKDPCYPNCCPASDNLKLVTKCSRDTADLSHSTPHRLEQVLLPHEQLARSRMRPEHANVLREVSEPATSLTDEEKMDYHLAESQKIWRKIREQSRHKPRESRTSSSNRDYVSGVEPQSLSSNPISIGIGSNPSQSQGLHTIDSQPSTSQTIKPRLVQVKVEETKTLDPVATRSLPPTRVKLVSKPSCSACKKVIIGFNYQCSTVMCKVCVQCLVMSALPPKTCPGCRQITLSDEAVDILEKFRPN